jgi:hypothetical protein
MYFIQFACHKLITTDLVNNAFLPILVASKCGPGEVPASVWLENLEYAPGPWSGRNERISTSEPLHQGKSPELFTSGPQKATPAGIQ